jgi:hypothetical protein
VKLSEYGLCDNAMSNCLSILAIMNLDCCFFLNEIEYGSHMIALSSSFFTKTKSVLRWTGQVYT